MYHLYILHSENCNRTYTGMSSNIERRLKQHNSNQNHSTKNCNDWIIIHSEECHSRVEARKIEKYYKSTSGRRKIKLILEKHLNEKSN